MSQGREWEAGGIFCSLVAEKAGMEEHREQRGDLDWMGVMKRTSDGRRDCSTQTLITVSRTLLSVLHGAAGSDNIQDHGRMTQLSPLTALACLFHIILYT